MTNTLTLEDWFVDQDTEDEICELKTARSRASLTEKKSFIAGVFEAIGLRTGCIQEAIRVYHPDGFEEFDPTMLVNGDYCFLGENGHEIEIERPDDIDSESDVKYREILDHKYQEISKETDGYLIFVGIDMLGYYYLQIDVDDGKEYLRGMKWAYEFMNWGNSDYGIDALFLNGNRIENIPEHIESLVQKI
jgi:hypothetical protein